MGQTQIKTEFLKVSVWLKGTSSVNNQYLSKACYKSKTIHGQKYQNHVYSLTT